MKKSAIFIAIVYSCVLGYAQTTRVQVGDLFYNLSDGTASVTTSDKIPSDCRYSYPSKYIKDFYVIPSQITYEGQEYEVVAIDDWAFAGFTSDLYASPTVRHAKGSKAQAIILPPSIKRIGKSAFANCTNLKQMIIPASVESLGSGHYDYDSPFYNTPLLSELIYLSPNAPSNWHATLKTFVPSLSRYGKPSTSTTEYSILPISSTSDSVFIYSGESPSLTLSNNLEGYNLEYDNPILKKDVGSYNVLIDARIVNDTISYETSIPVHYEIEPVEVTVSMSNASRKYGDSNPEFILKYDGLVNNETEDVLDTKAYASTTASVYSDVGTYRVYISGAKGRNYTFKYVEGKLIIIKADLELSVNNTTKIYGSPNPDFTLSYSGIKNYDKVPEWNEYPTISTTAERYSDAGIYEISAKGGDAQNYNITKYNSGMLTVNKANQTLTWNQNMNVQKGSKVVLKATSSSGLPVSYELFPNDVVKLHNDDGIWSLDCIGSGYVRIQAIQNGGKNYNAATVLEKMLVVYDAGADPQITLNVEPPGSLSSLIAENRKYQVKNLRLTGFLNGTDIKLLREMAGSDSTGNATPGILETLDISECVIVSGGDNYYESYQTSDLMIDNHMFYNCKQLKDLLLPVSTSNIGSYALADCDKLSIVSIPDGVRGFWSRSFQNDISLLEIPMPKSLWNIGDMAFMGCNGLSEITLPPHVYDIGENIVKDC